MLRQIIDESKHFVVSNAAVWFWVQGVKRLKSFRHSGSWKLNEIRGTFVTARPKAAYIVRAILQIRSAASACPEPKPLGSERLQTSTDAVAMHGNTYPA